MVRIHIKSNIMSVLFWVYTVCKDYQQMAKSPLTDKEVNPRRSYVQVDLDFLNVHGIALIFYEKKIVKISKYET